MSFAPNFILIPLALAAMASASPFEFDAGKAVYRDKCASCHGERGEGVADEYDEPLFGDRSLKSLSRLIHRTMPEEDPDDCLDEEAEQVAAYIYHAFYSLEARHKNGLVPRVELARLTVEQHRNALADVVGRFAPAPAQAVAGEPGLRALYYQATRKNKTDRLDLERVDRAMDFDFGECAPAGLNYIEQLEPIPEGASETDRKKIEMYRKDGPRYSILWEGAFESWDTGYHEFRITTENGVRLFFNHDYSSGPRPFGEGDEGRYEQNVVQGQKPVIDAWVSSSKGAEHTARVFLIEGRRYPLRLEFFKSREKTGSLKFEWKPPHGSWTVLDQKRLRTAEVPRVFAVESPFPADDRSRGYERGSSVSNEWQNATTRAAIQTANEVIARLPQLAGYDKTEPDGKAVLSDFMARFASAAFRRPLTPAEDRLYRETLYADQRNLELATRRAILLALSSPNFLYTEVAAADSEFAQFNTASRLAFALWDSAPDAILLDAAAKGELATKAQIEAQSARMIADDRTKAKLRSFFHHWLEFEERDLAKDRELFPEFDDAVIADLRHSLETFIDEIVWDERSDYRQLLLADYLVVNENLRGLYQPEANAPKSGGGFQNLRFSPTERAGLLTHPYLLSAFAYHNNTSPIHRGVFLTRNIVGRSLRPPPDAVAFNDDEFDPTATMREKVTQLTRDKSCMSCHSVINPLGFALENYDAIGRWRTSDNLKAVDSKSEYVTEDGDTLEVANARDIANIAVKSESAPRAFIRELFQHMVKQSPAAYGADTLENLRRDFIESGYNIQKLVARIAVVPVEHTQTDPLNRPKT